MLSAEVTQKMSDSPRGDEWKPGWHMRDDVWYLTKDAIKREFKLSKDELRQIIEDKYIENRALTNFHNGEVFTVYRLEHVKAMLGR
jgi:hypothetical protein